MKDEQILVFSTTSSIGEAEKVAARLLETRKAACVNIIPGMRSWYWWKGKIEKDEEVFLLIKSSKQILNDVIALIKKHHSYETPEVVAVKIFGGSPDYLSWLSAELGEGFKSGS